MDNNELNPDIEKSEDNAENNLSGQETEKNIPGNGSNSGTNEFEEFMRQNGESPFVSAQNGSQAESGAEYGNGSDTSEAMPDMPIQESPENEYASSPDADGSGKKKKSRGAAAAVIILIAVLIAATGFMIYSIIGSKSGLKVDLDKTVVTVDGIENSAAEYMAEYMQVYSYYSAYGSYYQYTEEDIKKAVLQEFIYMDAFYAKAIAEGYTLTEEDTKTIDDTVAELTQYAESASMTADEYLEESFCKGFGVDEYRAFFEKRIIANRYQSDNMDKIAAQFKGNDASEKILAEYKKNSEKYDLCNAERWMVDSTDENSDAYADKVLAEIKSGKTLKEAVVSVTGDSEAVINDMKGYSYDDVSSNFSKDAADWLFEKGSDGEYTNGKGSAEIVEANDMTFVIYVTGLPARDETLPSTLKYIQVNVGTDTTISTEDELKLTAKANAAKILNEFNNGDKSAESFEKLMEKYENGANDLIGTGEFDNVKGDGSNDSAVEEWAADASRKVGDCEIVEGDGCYYVLFYAEKAENPVWYQSVYDSLVSSAQSEWQKNNADAENTDRAVTDDDAIAKIIAYINEKSAVAA